MRWLFFGIWTVLWITAQTALVGFADAQPSQPPASTARQRSNLNPDVRQLHEAVQQNLGGASIQTADSLLQAARRLADQAGQVVVLSQLAALYAEQDQDQTAGDLAAQATRLGGQLQLVSEAGWAMANLGRLQRQYKQRSVLFGPVFSALGMAMGQGTVTLWRERGSRTDSGYVRQRGLGKSVYPNGLVDGVLMPPLPAFAGQDGERGAGYRSGGFPGRIRAHFTDQWLDSLISASLNGSTLGKQLNAKKQLRDASQQLSTNFAQKGDYAKAYNYFLQYTAYKDSLTAEVTAHQLALLQYKQTNQKKEAQIKLLTQERLLRDQEADRQRQLLAALGGWVVLLLVAAVLLVRANRARKHTNQQLSDQKQALEETLSELKATQNQLIQSEKMASLGELTAGIAHEIQNPLNFVNNFAEVSTELVSELSEEVRRPDRDGELETELLTDLGQNLAKITHHGSRASAIVRGMLEHSRSMVGEKQPTDLNKLSHEYLKLAYHAMRIKEPTFEATLQTDLDADLGPVALVEQEFGRVLLNLFNNAFYALCKQQQLARPTYQPTLLVTTKQVAKAVVLTIRDNGTGMSAGVQSKVFQPFFTTKPTGEGTGLGLSLSYDIITKGYGGTLTVDSEEGQFTEFTITVNSD
ncbi:sensor histidine kinase [Fibrella aquatilis]|uniref:histidine kinase n=1 Tax=Fibrella aquatilis TaxID=2817059 RepID=A0A939G940_9BACT|nr:ATP-binding protein [Fibrella aquatilis]MBO0933493.1 GHKL domain-containing protein [Fibrella aquatilis]